MSTRTPTRLRYPELKAELARREITNIMLAAALGLHVGTVSQILHGRLEPNDALKQRIADRLGREVDELFEPAS